jgi:hypothetical protein
MAVQQLSNKNDDGAILGQSSSDLIGFYGLSAGVARPSVSAYTTTTASVSTSTNWGYTTSTQADAINTQIVAITAALRTMGLVG